MRTVCGDFFQAKVLDQETVLCTLTKDLQFTTEKAREMFTACNTLISGKYFLISHFNVKLQPSKDVFEFYASAERTSRIFAEAYVLGSPMLRITGNYYMKFKRPKIKTKMFDDLDEAMAWIELIKTEIPRR